MEIYHIPNRNVDDTYLGSELDRKHVFPSFPNRMNSAIERMKHDSNLLLRSTPLRNSTSSEILLKSRTIMPLARSLPNDSSNIIDEQHTGKVSFAHSKNFKRISRKQLKSLDLDKEFDYLQPISNSFSTFETTTQAVQATGTTLLRLQLKDYKEVRAWTASVVDPFLKQLRLAIINNRPREIEEYTAVYLSHLFQKRQPPLCVDEFYVEKKIKMKRKMRRRRTVIELARQHKQPNSNSDEIDDEVESGEDEEDNEDNIESNSMADITEDSSSLNHERVIYANTNQNEKQSITRAATAPARDRRISIDSLTSVDKAFGVLSMT